MKKLEKIKYMPSIKNKIYYSEIFLNKDILNLFKLIEVQGDFINKETYSTLKYQFLSINKEAKDILETREDLFIGCYGSNYKKGKIKYILFNEYWCGPGADILYSSENLSEIIYFGFDYLIKLKNKNKKVA